MNRRTHVGFHVFSTYNNHPGYDGANFAYSEISHLLSESDLIDVSIHDLVALCENDNVAREALQNCDVVVCTVGPHAYFYFYLREKLNLNFRIIRDVRTALWNAYMLQEVLVAPYLRNDDIVIHSSKYSKFLYRSLFPNVIGSDYVCYPLLRWFPNDVKKIWRGSNRNEPFTIGYVGRLTEDKNFIDTVNIFSKIQDQFPGKFRLRAIGQGVGSYGHKYVSTQLGSNAVGYEWYPPVNRQQLWRHYAEMDVLFFPSTSTLETFGRVLLEASFVGTPIIASEHAASSELLDKQALVHTKYTTNIRFNMHDAASLGQISIEDAVQLLVNKPIVHSDAHELYGNDDKHFLNLVIYSNSKECEKGDVTKQQQHFINSISMDNLNTSLNASNIDMAMESLRKSFVNLNRHNNKHFLTLAYLLYKSNNRMKTLNFIGRNLFKGEDFTNIGGVDLQFSHFLNFYPSFTLKSQNNVL